MNSSKLKELQAPIKARYQKEPEAARVVLRGEAMLSDGIACKIATGKALVEAGLHPATGGEGSLTCSGDMLLEALAACAGVTLKAVATALDISVQEGKVVASGTLDFRGTLGVSKEVPVGFAAIDLTFDLKTDATPEQLATLLRLTERYCVVLQTLRVSPRVAAAIHKVDL